jgi:sensor histidine kinase regulating citrate/malate metabolism
MQEQKYNATVHILHDVDKHVKNIENLCVNGENGEAAEYVKEIRNMLEPLIPVRYTGNLIDNAIEAAEKVNENRYIKISISPYQEMVLVRIENTSLPLKWKNGMPVSEKGKNHGIGLLNVKRSIEKYDGDISFQQKSGIVTVDLLLNS